MLRYISCMFFNTLRWFKCCSVFCSASYNLCPFSFSISSSFFCSSSALYRTIPSPIYFLQLSVLLAAAFLPHVEQSTAFHQTASSRLNLGFLTDLFPPKHSSSSFCVCENHPFFLFGQPTLFCSGIFCHKWKKLSLCSKRFRGGRTLDRRWRQNSMENCHRTQHFAVSAHCSCFDRALAIILI